MPPFHKKNYCSNSFPGRSEGVRGIPVLKEIPADVTGMTLRLFLRGKRIRRISLAAISARLRVVGWCYSLSAVSSSRL